MQLDYIPNINAYGENLVRLYDFDKAQSIKFREVLRSFIKKKEPLELSTLDFIKSRNCLLTLRITDEVVATNEEEDEDKLEGISRLDKLNFFCDLTIAGYEEMIERIEPFCQKETKGHQYLYELDVLTDFLYCPSGTW